MTALVLVGVGSLSPRWVRGSCERPLMEPSIRSQAFPRGELGKSEVAVGKDRGLVG